MTKKITRTDAEVKAFIARGGPDNTQDPDFDAQAEAWGNRTHEERARINPRTRGALERLTGGLFKWE